MAPDRGPRAAQPVGKHKKKYKKATRARSAVIQKTVRRSRRLHKLIEPEALSLAIVSSSPPPTAEPPPPPPPPPDLADDPEPITNPIDYWRREGRWPHQYSEDRHTMSTPRGRSASRTSFRASSSNRGRAATPSDQRPREEKVAPYSNAQYEMLLLTKGSFLTDYPGPVERGPNTRSLKICADLLNASQPTPENTLLGDDSYLQTCYRLGRRNESRVIQDIGRLVAPSAETLFLRGATHLECLVESVNEGWNHSMPLTQPRPQPDYAVGFDYPAFTEDQRQKLQPFATFYEPSLYKGTHYMYFPFFTCEVKCGSGGQLVIADRQNAHSMTLAVRGVVDLFRKVKREKELHREILAWSISHDETTANIYGHYAVINGTKTTFHRYSLDSVSLSRRQGQERWTPYRFTMNLYENWMPTHFQRLCSAIADIPEGINFDLSTASNLDFASPPENSEPGYVGSSAAGSEATGASEGPRRPTPETSYTRPSDRASDGDYTKPKRPRK